MLKTRNAASIAALSLSLAILIAAMATAWRVGLAANDVEHRLFHANETLERLRGAVAELEGQRAAGLRVHAEPAR